MNNDLEKGYAKGYPAHYSFIMLLYFIAFLDRVNIGFAALTMNQDSGFRPPFWAGCGHFLPRLLFV